MYRFDAFREPTSTRENWKNFHYCELPHSFHLYGPAVEDCFEDEDGRLFVDNGEYGSQVNYCPVCGYKAKIMMEESI